MEDILKAAMLVLLSPGEGIVLDMEDKGWFYLHQTRQGEIDCVPMVSKSDLPHGLKMRVPRRPRGEVDQLPPVRRYSYRVVYDCVPSDMLERDCTFSSLIADLINRPEQWSEESGYILSAYDSVERA